jgi:mono/diheme cytochrome c family protein
MKPFSIIPGAFLLLISTTGCQPPEAAQAEAPVETQAHPAVDLVERGEYLVTVAGCNDCHTPFKMGPNGPEPDMSRMLAGHPQNLQMPAAPAAQGPWIWAGAATNTAFAGPWGVSYASNLTPEPNSGIGIWTEDLFIKALRSGRHWGQARPILPPMPWQNYSRMTDDDLKAMYAYLRTIPPVANSVPESIPAPAPQSAALAP